MVLLRRNLELTKLKLCGGMERDGRHESKDILAGTKLNEDDVVVSRIYSYSDSGMSYQVESTVEPCLWNRLCDIDS